jgi:UDP:flavonoid glycosyltransferase YjiC (YdhE family)
VPLEVVPESMAFSIEALVQSAQSTDPSKLSRAVLELGFTPHVEAMYAAAIELCSLAFKKPPAEFFAAKGLPVPRHTIPDVIFSDRLNLHAASPTLCPPAPDWSDIHQVCGEFFLPERLESWTPSPGLRVFLEEGAPPVFMSLGSMEHMAPERAKNLLIDAAREAKVRAILQTKRDGAEGRDGDLYVLPWAPHRHLFPLCSAVVHHGGAGTTHAALRAGRPSVVLPFIFEQRLWGARLRQVGAAPALVSFWKATAGKVARRILDAVQSPVMSATAAKLAQAMSAEDGTGRATRLLEAL